MPISTSTKKYGLLSQVAPTTAYETAPASDAWQTTLRSVGTALGRSREAEEAQARVQDELSRVARRHPELDGKQFAIGNVFQAGSIGVLRTTEDAGVKLLAQFGMQLAPSVADLPGDQFAVQLSLERLDVLDVDILLLYTGDADEAVRRSLKQNPLYRNLKVVQRGSVVEPTVEEFWLLRAPTVLSLPYLLSNVVPPLADAARKAG